MKGLNQPWLACLLLLMSSAGWAAENFTLRVWQVRDGLPQNQVTDIAQTADGYLWFATLNGLARFDGVQFRVFDHTNTEGMESSRVEGVRVENGDKLLVELEGGLSGFFGEQGFEIGAAQELESLGEQVDATAASAKGGRWIAGERQLRRFVDDQVAEDYGPYPFIPPLRVTAMLEDRSGRLWLATDGDGVFCYFGRNRADEFRGPEGMPENRVRCLFEDRDGNVWAGTDGGGVVRFRPRLFKSPAGTSEPVVGRVNSVAVDGTDDVWVGTEEAGLHIWDGAKLVAALPEELNRIVTILAEENGLRVLVGTDGQGLFRVKRQGTESLELSFGEIPGFRTKRIQALLRDRAGVIWVGMPTGLAEVHDDRVEWIDLGDVRCLAQTKDGAICVGLHGGGLARMHGSDFQRFDRESGLPDDYVWSLLADDDGGLWIGTFGGGLVRFHGGEFKTLGVRHGLPDKVVSTLLMDLQRDLWLGSQRGVVHLGRGELDAFFAGKKSRIGYRLYDVDDGLDSAECVGGHQPNGVTAHTGELIFATLKGAVMIVPQDLQAVSAPPPVLIQSIQLDDDLVFESLPGRPESGDRAGPILAGPGRVRIGIDYAGMDFAKPDKVTYRHRLIGRGEEWLEVGGQRRVIFDDLSPGDYRFEVMAVKADGTTSIDPAEVSFSVLPFFWQTTWFRLLAILGTAGLIGWIVRVVSLRRVKMQMEKLEQELAVQNERTRIANDLHDDLGARLTQLAFLSDLAQRDTDQLNELGDAARDTAASLDELVWTVNPKNDRLDRLVRFLVDQARGYCEATGLRCEVVQPASVPDLEVSGGFRHNLFMVVKEALNNTAKHAQATRVELKLQIGNGRLDMSIRDDGSGFDQEAKADSGNGLGNYVDRIAALRGTVKLSSEPGKGTRLEISVPLQFV